MRNFCLWIFFILFIQNFNVDSGEFVWLKDCHDNNDCRGLTNATCLNNRCFCNDFYVCQTESGILVNKIGEKCDSERICNAKNTVCKEEICLCQEGFVATKDLRRCLKAAGTNCTIDEDCSLTYSSSCVNSKCSCLETHVEINHSCLPIATNIGDECEEDVQCASGFGKGVRCVQNACRCKDAYHFNEAMRKCLRDKFLGDICESSEDCHQPGQENSRLICILGECRCEFRYTEEDGYCIENNDSVLKQAPKFYLFFLVVVHLM